MVSHTASQKFSKSGLHLKRPLKPSYDSTYDSSSASPVSEN